LNGSPTNEFIFERGLRQGDPLLPFLFLIGVEGLNFMMNALMDGDLYLGYKVGRTNDVLISYSQFVDDTLLLGVKGWANIRSLKASYILFRQH
jgi:hypothetical protein